MPGTLFVVATPLGNLDDLSPRALATLRSVAAIACEDTRRTARLLARYAVTVPTLSCHEFNERRRVEPLLDRLRAGESLALVTDAGTPGVSDPGALLVRAVHEAGLRVSPLPGPSAVAALISVSGLPAERYVFEGFLPARGGERRRRLRELATDPRTLVLFEAPHRLLRTLSDVEEVLGPRHVVLGRELTKLHEEVVAGPPARIAERLREAPVRGEITLAVEGWREGPQACDATAREILAAFRAALDRAGGDRREALRRAAKELGLARAELRRRLDELDPP